MKNALTIPLALAFALPLFADEPRRAQEKPVQAPASATASQPAKQADSPLVAAAKRANRIGKKRNVITNESLAASKGHVTSTTVATAPSVPAPELGPEAKLAQEKAAKAAEARRAQEEVAAKEKAAAEENARIAARKGAAMEEGLASGHDDAEGYFDDAGSETKPPQI